MQIKLIYPVMKLFEGGAAGAGGAASAGAETGSSAGENNTASVTGKQKGAYANVLFGNQESASLTGETEAEADNAGPQVTEEDRAKAYKDFITQNKDLYEADLNEKFKKKTAKRYELEGQIKDQQSVIDRMMARYGLEGGDLKALNEAMDNDDTYYSQKADEMGMTLEQYKRFEMLETQNRNLMRSQSERLAQEEAIVQEQKQNEQINKWLQEAEQVKQTYPEFNLEQELQNPRFGAALKSRVFSMSDLYKTFHFDELMQNTAAQTAQNTEKAVTNNIRARGSRPRENGTISQSAFTVKNDVSKLTAADRAEIARRVQRGEHISFGP